MKKLTLVLILACLAVATFAVRAQTPAANHTVVRFNVVAGGTNFGTLDFELFDQEKPETVRNFLMYVYSGSYSNVVIQRLAFSPISVLQAGHIRVEDPTDHTNPFSTFPLWNDFGQIANEYGAGPKLKNDFGTVALARIKGQTNSGSFDWFINMGNNPLLDTADGGFTVFGRIVNTTDARSGTNLLNFFNTFVKGVNTRLMIFFDYGLFEPDFPTTEPAVGEDPPLPTPSQLFVLQPSFLQGGQTHDMVAPALQINEPADMPVILGTEPAKFRFSGTASDNQQLARVLYDVKMGEGFIVRSVVASGKENWMADIALEYGTNEVSFRGVDFFGNLSPAVKRTINFPFRGIALNIFGKGKVTGLTNGQFFPLGVTNTLVAKPAPGQFFLYWQGAANSAERTVSFVVTPETREVNAIFARTFLGLSNGAYQGVLLPLSNQPPRNAGFINFNLNSRGEYFGRLAPLGANYPIHGEFTQDFTSTITGQRGADPLLLRLILFGGGTIQGDYFDGPSYSIVAAGLVKKFSRTSPTPQAGKYTYLISPTTNSTLRSGYGAGAATIDALGKIKMNGTLADVAPVRQNAALLANDRWAFVASANGGRDAVVGLVALNASHVFTGDAVSYAPDFPGNTNQGVSIWGSPYKPPSQARLFNWTNGRITFSGNGLGGPVSTDLVLNDNGSFTLPANPYNIQLSVADATGLITGSLNHPNGGALTPLRGAVLQSSNMAAGSFGAGASAGGFVIRAQ